jgi:hypothetical protein
MSKIATAACGLVALVGAFAAGTFMATRGSALTGLPVAQALSAMGDNSFAVCTASIDNATEGFFLLDFETGDLTGGVLNQTSTKFTAAYRHNVLKDLGFKPGQVKAPRFLMVPGRMSFGGTMGNRLAPSVIYVTDASTGVSVAYGIPWSMQQSSGRGGVSELQPLDMARPRGGVAP